MRSLQVGESFLAKNLTERQIWNIISNEHRFSPEKRFTSKDKRLGAGSVRVIRNTKAFPNG